MSLRAFIQAATRGAPPAVTGMDALYALALVKLLLASAERGQMLRFREQVQTRGWGPMMGM